MKGAFDIFLGQLVIMLIAFSIMLAIVFGSIGYGIYYLVHYHNVVKTTSIEPKRN